MDPITHRFHEPDQLIDRLHAVFETWEQEQVFAPALDDHTLHQLKLAVHEWLANLVQHAEFGTRDPEVTFTVALREQALHCTIEDNSDGFDLDGHLSAKKEVLDSFPERGMGLLMIKACTQNLSYRQLDETTHRLEFSISAEQDPWLNIPF